MGSDPKTEAGPRTLAGRFFLDRHMGGGDPAGQDARAIRAIEEEAARLAPARFAQDVTDAMDELHAARLVSPADREGLDTLGHAVLVEFFGGVNPNGHQTNPDGSPFGDCYKCRRVGDFIAARLG